MNVPSISGPRGLFDVFVPGVFLVLNVGLLLSRVASLDRQQAVTHKLFSSGPVLAAVLIATGYLAGGVLRLVKTQLADRCSTWVLIHRLPRTERARLAAPQPAGSVMVDDRTADQQIHGYLQSFPYGNWLCTDVAKRLGPEVEQFVRLHWSRACAPSLDTTFFNHWKTILALRHPALYANLLAEESLVRFVASMYYALCASLVLLVGSSAVGWFSQGASGPTIEAVLFLLYVIAIGGILVHFRHLRAREAAIFLSACYEAQCAADREATKRSIRGK